MVEVFNKSNPLALHHFHEFPEIKPSADVGWWQWLSDCHKSVHTWAVDAVSHVPRWLVYSGLTVGVATTMAYLYSQPAAFALYAWGQRVDMWRAGYKVKSVSGKKYRYSYIERGSHMTSQPSILLINGLGATKEDWLTMAKLLPQNMHVVCVDLLSQGNTTIPTDMKDASLYKLSDYLHEFVELSKMDRKPFHLVGLSMGGAICGIYAAKHPKNVDRLTLMCPAMQCPINTTIWKEDTNKYMSDDPVEFRNAMIKCVYNKSLLPDALWIYKALIEQRKPKHEFTYALTRNIKVEVEDREFEQVLSTICVPVQIIWGEEDEIMHVSGASLLEQLIDSVKRTDILPRCGHAIHFEQSEVTKSLLLDFYNTTYSS